MRMRRSSFRNPGAYGGIAVTGLLLLILSTSCMYEPLNGTRTSAPVVGRSVDFEGAYTKPGVPVDVQVLKIAGLDPNKDSSWVTIGTTNTRSTPVYMPNSPDPLYFWDLTAVPRPGPGFWGRWPRGGLARVRAVAEGQALATFDEATFADCQTESLAAGENWFEMGQRCIGLGRFGSFLVSTSPSPVDFPDERDYLGRKGDIADPSLTASYYATIGAPQSLDAFKTQFGFPTGEVTATYYNDGDLGIGREMHCKKAGAKTACYVSNYSGVHGQGVFPSSDPPQDPNAALAAAVARQGKFATVAMVHDPANAANPVQFMVYDAGGSLSPTAALDSTAEHVSVPNNCLSCHGIFAVYTPAAPPATPSVSGAQFLPFDVFSFRYSSAPGFTQADQADAFRRLNKLVRETNPVTGIVQFIDGLYAPKSVSDPAAVANDDYVPQAWKTEPCHSWDGIALYRGVIKPGCRTCHMSSSISLYDFLDYSDFAIAQKRISNQVCDAKEMPQAEHVMRKFWDSGARAYLLAGLELVRTNPCVAVDQEDLAEPLGNQPCTATPEVVFAELQGHVLQVLGRSTPDPDPRGRKQNLELCLLSSECNSDCCCGSPQQTRAQGVCQEDVACNLPLACR